MTDVNNDLKLYSISAAAKKLSIRKQQLSNLISSGKIGILTIGKRRKVPHCELVKFTFNNTYKLNNQATSTLPDINSLIQKYKSPNRANATAIIEKLLNAKRGL